jgi:uncharacterized protein YegL
MLPSLDAKVQEVFDDFYSISVSVPTPAPPTIVPHIYFALDISGSMGGEKIEIAKQAINLLIGMLKGDNIHISLIDFDDTATYHDSREIGYDKLIEYNSMLSARGGTRFVNVFAMLKDNIEKHKDLSSCIIWLTDGQDNDGLGVLGPCMEGFKKWILEKKLLTAIHTVGIGSDHDTEILTTMLKFGTQEGTFQYAEHALEIFDCVDRLSTILHVRGGWGFVRGKNEYKIGLPYDEEQKAISGLVFMKGADLKDLKLEVYLNGEKKDYNLSLVKVSEEFDPRLFSAFTKEKLKGIVESLAHGGLSGDALAVMKAEVEKINGMTISIMNNLKTVAESKRNLLLPICMNVILLNQQLMYILMSEHSHGISRHILAKLYHLCYRGVLGEHRRRLKALFKKGGMFKAAEDFIDSLNLAAIPAQEMKVVQGSLLFRLNKVQDPGILLGASVFGFGDELSEVYNAYGPALKIPATDPFTLISIPVKDPAKALPALKEIVEVLWEMAKMIAPESDFFNMAEVSVEALPGKVAVKILSSPTRRELIDPIIEKLRAQAIFAIPNQHLNLRFSTTADLSQVKSGERSIPSLLIDGIEFVVKSSVINKLGILLRESGRHMLPYAMILIPTLKRLGLVTRLEGELVFEMDAFTKELVLEEVNKSGAGNIPLKEMREQMKPMVAQWIEGIPILKKVYEFVKNEVQGLDIIFYGAGLLGFKLSVKLRGLGEMIDMEK